MHYFILTMFKNNIITYVKYLRKLKRKNNSTTHITFNDKHQEKKQMGTHHAKFKTSRNSNGNGRITYPTKSVFYVFEIASITHFI